MQNDNFQRHNLEHIARCANVSLATVSRVLNDKENVSEKTRSKVFAAMRELRYRVPVKNVIALIVPDSSNPFFSQLGFSLEQALEAIEWHLFISSSEGKPDRELQLTERFKGLGVKGLVYISSGRSSNTLYSLIAEGDLPVVVFDREVMAGNFDFVTVDSRHGTLCAVDYLAAHGHQRIGYLKGLEKTRTAKERFDSYIEAMNQNKFTIYDEWVFDGEYTHSSGLICAEKLLNLPASDRPTAMLAANDLMAIGLMQRLQIAGWVLPRDLSVIGFDNIQWAEWIYPPLTTIAQPMSKLVSVTIKLLTERIKEQHSKNIRRSPRREVLQPTLIPRASVCEPISTKSHSLFELVPKKELQNV